MQYYVTFDANNIVYIHLFLGSSYDLLWHSEQLCDADSNPDHFECLCNLCNFNLLKIVLKICQII